MYLMASDKSPNYGTALVQRVTGLGCASCSAGRGCDCGPVGMTGLGIFDSWDLSTWGVAEWLIVSLGTVGLYSVFSSSRRGVQRVRKGVRRRRARKAAASTS